MSAEQSSSVLVFGSLSMTDDLRVEVNVARDEVLRVPFAVESAVRLAVLRGLRGTDSLALQKVGSSTDLLSWEQLSSAWRRDFNRDDAMNPLPSRLKDADGYFSVPSAVDVLTDPLCKGPSGWRSEPLFVTEEGDRLSVSDLERSLAARQFPEFYPSVSLPWFDDWDSIVGTTLLLDRFELALSEEGMYSVIGDALNLPSFLADGPYFVASLWDTDILIAQMRTGVTYLNIKHPFVAWVVRVASLLEGASLGRLVKEPWLQRRGGSLTAEPLRQLLMRLNWKGGVQAEPFSSVIDDSSIFVEKDAEG